MKKHSFNYHYVHLLPNEQLGMHFQEDWEVNYIVKGVGKLVYGEEHVWFASGDVFFIPFGVTNCFLFNDEVTNEDGEVLNICLHIEDEFLKRLANNFPEFAEDIRRICAIREPVKYDAAHSVPLIDKLEIMVDMTDAERIPYVIELLSLL